MHRARKLLLPYAKWAVVVILFSAVDNMRSGQFTLRWLVSRVLGALYSRYGLYPYGSEQNIYFLDNAGAMWFITALFSSYLLFYAAMYLIGREPGLLRCVEVGAGLLCGGILFRLLPILLPWSLDTAFLGGFFMLVGYGIKRLVCKRRFSSTDRLLLAIEIGTLYVMLVRVNLGVNMSVRLYGPHGSWSVLLFAIIGPLGALLYMELGRWLCRCPILKWPLLAVNHCAYPLMAMQFWFLGKAELLFPAVEFSNRYAQYGYGVLKAVAVLLACMALQAVDDGLTYAMRALRVRRA